MSFPSSDVVRGAARYYETSAVASAITALRPDLTPRVSVTDEGSIFVQIDVGASKRVVVAHIKHHRATVWAVADPTLNQPPATWPLGTSADTLAAAAIACVDRYMKR